jgi:hypothetical protein
MSFENRLDLLGHRSSRITTHYSAAELQSLIEAANSGARGKLPKKSRTGDVAQGLTTEESTQ